MLLQVYDLLPSPYFYRKIISVFVSSLIMQNVVKTLHGPTSCQC